ncbi:MAG TPA: beta-hydroxyacyl-ACP dehydratase, partial [Deltaproteobacteria bacterium]|nr:beta-hydroxyacyl-ACP dehydratase [Deltaproteobacteria bacterium]
MNLEEIKKILPHRYPFLLVDRVLKIRAGEYCQALKNISGNEAVFQGHFPQQAVFPGVMIIEALAQTAGIVIDSGKDETESGSIVFFAGINNAKFRVPVVPGDQLICAAFFSITKSSFSLMEMLRITVFNSRK